ncbi:hypothetical protein BN433_0732 [Erwinia amylovora Ea266]|nr:hypothetical protein BN433_0732 [Erwinia amylovora Ea266]
MTSRVKPPRRVNDQPADAIKKQPYIMLLLALTPFPVLKVGGQIKSACFLNKYGSDDER